MRGLVLGVLLMASSARAQPAALELSGGASSLLVFGPLSGQTSVAGEVALSGPLAEAATWTGGARVGVGAWSSSA